MSHLRPGSVDSNSRQTAPAPRARFGLKALFIAITLLCILFGLISQPLAEYRHQQQLLARARELGAKISIEGFADRERSFARTILSMFESSFESFRLYKLDLSNSKFKDENLAEIAEIQHVKELNLSNTLISDDGLQHLQGMRFLRKLDLSGTTVTDQSMVHLNRLRNLASFNAARTQLTYASLEQLDAKLPWAHFCEERAIAELKAAGIQVVNFTRFIDLPGTGDTIRAREEAVDVIVGMNRPIRLTNDDVINLGHLQSVREMRIHDVDIGPDGLAALKPMRALKDFSIYYTNLSDRDLQAVARQTQLEKLTIYECKNLTDDGLAHLKALTNLKELSIKACPLITKLAMSALAKELPDCKFEHAKY